MAEPKLKLVHNEAQSKNNTTVTKRNLLPLFTLTLVVLNLSVMTSMLYFENKMWVRLLDLTQRFQTTALETKNLTEEEKSKQEKGRVLAEGVQGTLLPLDSFLVNITSDQGPKYLQAQMEFELSDPSLEDEVTRKKAVIRDAIIVLFSSKSYRELREASSMKTLRADIIKSVNNLLTTGKITEIYFTQFHFN